MHWFVFCVPECFFFVCFCMRMNVFVLILSGSVCFGLKARVVNDFVQVSWLAYMKVFLYIRNLANMECSLLYCYCSCTLSFLDVRSMQRLDWQREWSVCNIIVSVWTRQTWVNKNFRIAAMLEFASAVYIVLLFWDD